MILVMIHARERKAISFKSIGNKANNIFSIDKIKY